jgi:RimJ/RimL family protein N-acetyltransferase
MEQSQASGPVRVRLLAIDEDAARSLAGGRFEEAHRVRLGIVAPLVGQIVRDSLAFLGGRPRPDPWGAYLAIDPGTAEVVGTCAFKSAPHADGGVEIAYFTFPPFEGRGYATAMAGALASLAFTATEVRRVFAHTLPGESASTRVLEKNGLQFAGEVVDPEEGRVWLWERSRGS